MNQPLLDSSVLAPAALPCPVECRGLSVAYGKATRLLDVSVTFPRQRITAILGPSGCGKSTLLRSLNRTLELIPGARVETGTVLVDGIDAYGKGSAASRVRAQIGMLHQKPTPFPMSILDNVLFGARYHGLCRNPLADAQHFLELVGLWDEVKGRLRTPALALSGGQQQRLCLARTLAVRPSIILMDEPCSALDPRATAVIEALARELVRNYTIIIVTHNVAQARRIADHCVFILDGQVLASGSRDEILTHPQNPAVRDFVTGVLG